MVLVGKREDDTLEIVPASQEHGRLVEDVLADLLDPSLDAQVLALVLFVGSQFVRFVGVPTASRP
jgi:hypothetical protein